MKKSQKKPPLSNAEKQRRFRVSQRAKLETARNILISLKTGGSVNPDAADQLGAAIALLDAILPAPRP